MENEQTSVVDDLSISLTLCRALRVIYNMRIYAGDTVTGFANFDCLRGTLFLSFILS